MYDESKDLVYVSKKFPASAGTTILISARSYNNGEPKIQITRFLVRGGDAIPVKTGRLTLDEAEKAAELILEIVPEVHQLMEKSRKLPGLFDQEGK